jgi:hypothetical protein
MLPDGIFHHTMQPSIRLALLVLVSLLIGCASAPEPTTVIRTRYNPAVEGFNNFLVISVTGDYATRALVERDIVSAISSDDVTASAWYTVIGRRPQVNRSLMEDSIRSRGFDAVLFIREKGQEQEELAPLRPVGAAFDLFGYDYEELNRDIQIEQSRAITFVIELYDAIAQQKVWAIEALSVQKQTLQDLIDEQVVTIALQLQEDELLGR